VAVGLMLDEMVVSVRGWMMTVFCGCRDDAVSDGSQCTRLDVDSVLWL